MVKERGPISFGSRQHLVARFCEHAIHAGLPQHAQNWLNRWINSPRRVVSYSYFLVNKYFHQQRFREFRATLLTNAHYTKSYLHLDLNGNFNFCFVRHKPKTRVAVNNEENMWYFRQFTGWMTRFDSRKGRTLCSAPLRDLESISRTMQYLIGRDVKKLRGLSPRADYTDRAAAAGRRS